MNETHRKEIIKKLRNYAVLFDDDTIEQYLIIIETYSNRDLQKLFENSDGVAIFLEDFLIRCFESNIYMNNLTTSEIISIGEVLQGDVGSELYNGLFGYYSWLSQMAEYFSSLKINSVSRSYYESLKKLLYKSETMRTNLFSSDIDDDVYKEIIINFNNTITSQLEDQYDDFIEECIMSIYDNNICTLEQKFIEFSENRIEIYSTNNRTYDKIIERVLMRLQILEDDVDYDEMLNLVRSIIHFKMAQQELKDNQRTLKRVLDANIF